MEQINLNIIPDGVMPVCHASQFDKSRTIRFNLKDNGSVYTLAGTETITCKVRKPDDTESTINVANTSSSYVDVTFGLGDTDLSGYAMCELKIVKGTQTIGSRNFLLSIEADAFDGSKFEERSASGAIASFETNYIDNLNELIVNITATQAGSGTSHSNPRPISGWSECNVTKCGKNLCNFFNDGKVPSVINGKLVNYNGCRTGYIKVHPSSLYTLSATFLNTPDCFIFFYDKDYNYLTSITGNVPLTRTTPSNCCYIMLRKDGALTDIVNAQLELGSTATEYEAFNGGTDTISLGDTYYGCTLNVTTGELTITHTLVDLGTLTWTKVTSFTNILFLATITGKATNNSNIICSNYNNVGIATGGTFLNNMANNSIASDTTTGTYIRDDAKSSLSAADFKTAMSGVQLVYELATPTTVQLTPTEVRTLLNCNIFADTGDVVSCKYLVEVT